MCVRVTRKSPIMVSNNNGVSKDRFTFDMIDSSGRMSGIAFGDECTRFFSVMEEDGIYEISGTGIVEVKSPLHGIPHQFQMMFSRFTKVIFVNIVH